MTNLMRRGSAPLIYAITDRQLLPGRKTEPDPTPLIEFIEQIVTAGVDMVQIRERDLTGRDLYRLTQTVADRLRGKQVVLTVNDRADIAACAGTGVHLTTRSLSAEVVRRAFGPDFFIGVSTHNEAEAEAAERGGADLIVFGPVFETASKSQYGEPVGVGALRAICARSKIPVIALGGIKQFNFHEALDAGAAGVAGISMFVDAFLDDDLRGLISTIRDFKRV